MKRYAFFNDTIEINNKVYSKLYDINDTTLNCSNATYLFPFREDSSKKVYFLYDTTEVLIYDFSLDVGDTIFYDYLIQGGLSPYEHYKRLDSTGTVDINGQVRNIYYLSGGITGNTWIEGIGAIDGEGLFAPVSDICLCGEILYLACVKQNDSVLWVSSYYTLSGLSRFDGKSWEKVHRYTGTQVHVLVINDKNVPLHLENRIKLPERKGGRSRQSE